jgi:hypothetical protein
MLPILLSGFGRSGSTALMALLGTDPRVAFDRAYPFEHRYLTYLAKLALVSSQPSLPSLLNATRLCDAEDEHFFPPPWKHEVDDLARIPAWFSAEELWHRLVAAIRGTDGAQTHYAEKVPHWVACHLRSSMPVRVIHLVRDPRDVYLSARDFARTRGESSFYPLAGNSEEEQALAIAHKLSEYASAEAADRGRPEALVVRYEEWVADPSALARRLGDWLGLDLDANSAEVSRHLDRHRTTANPADSVGRWRREPLPSAVTDILLPALGPYGAAYGYDLPGGRANILPLPQRKHSADGIWMATLDGVQVTLFGPDAWIELSAPELDAETVTEFWICCRSSTGESNAVYWCRAGEEFSEERVVSIPFRPGPHIQVVRIPVGDHLQWNGVIARLRIDLCNGSIEPGTDADVYWIRGVP